MICLKDKSTMAISCHIILVIGFLRLVSFFFFCFWASQSLQWTKLLLCFRSENLRLWSFWFNSSAFCLFGFFFCNFFMYKYNHSHCRRHQLHMATLVNVIYAIKKIMFTGVVTPQETQSGCLDFAIKAQCANATIFLV